MSLKMLYDTSTGSINPSAKTSLMPGGAGVQTAGTQTVPGISSPVVEASVQEVYDATAPTLIANNTQGLPAAAGKLLVADLSNGAFGSTWALNNAKLAPYGRGTFGIVVQAGMQSDTTTPVTTANGNRSLPGAKALVVTEGPVQAYLNTTVTNTAISAGMPLAADGAGNLTYAGASPGAGTVLAIAADSMSAGVSTPALHNVYVGGF